MASPTNAQARALGVSEALLEQAAAFLSGFNNDGTTYVTPASPSLIPNVAGNTAGTAISISATGSNSVATATLAAAAGKFTWISGFTCTASGATAGLPVVVTITGIVTGTMSFVFTYPAGVLVGASPLVVNFADPIPSSAVNTGIAVGLPAGGAGNTNSAVNAWGFQL